MAVCDPEPPGDTPGRARPPRRQAGDQLLTPAVAARRALAGIKEYGLAERENWAKALFGTEPAAPVLVQRLDHLDRFYYIVPMQRSARRIPVLVNVDARYATYQQAVAAPEGQTHLVPSLGREQLMKLVVDRRLSSTPTRKAPRPPGGALPVPDARLEAVPRIALALIPAVPHVHRRLAADLHPSRRCRIHEAARPGPRDL